MCIHKVNRGKDKLGRDVSSLLGPELDDFDSCDYIDTIPNGSAGDLTIIQLNIRGIYSKKTQLIDLIDNVLENNQPDLLLFSETWLTPNSPNLHIHGYSLIHKPRECKCGGGVGVLVSDELCCQDVTNLKFKSEEFESCFVEIPLRNGNSLLIGSMYRPPNTEIDKFNDEYNEILCKIKRRNYTYIVLGMDHNLDFLKCHTHKGTENFIQTNLDHLLFPTITRPTRITQSSATLIDNIIISQNLCGAFYSGIIPNDMSDHLPSVCILHSIQCPRKAPVRIFSQRYEKKELRQTKT